MCYLYLNRVILNFLFRTKPNLDLGWLHLSRIRIHTISNTAMILSKCHVSCQDSFCSKVRGSLASKGSSFFWLQLSCSSFCGSLLVIDLAFQCCIQLWIVQVSHGPPHARCQTVHSNLRIQWPVFELVVVAVRQKQPVFAAQEVQLAFGLQFSVAHEGQLVFAAQSERLVSVVQQELLASGPQSFAVL